MLYIIGLCYTYTVSYDCVLHTDIQNYSWAWWPSSAGQDTSAILSPATHPGSLKTRKWIIVFPKTSFGPFFIEVVRDVYQHNKAPAEILLRFKIMHINFCTSLWKNVFLQRLWPNCTCCRNNTGQALFNSSVPVNRQIKSESVAKLPGWWN